MKIRRIVIKGDLNQDEARDLTIQVGDGRVASIELDQGGEPGRGHGRYVVKDAKGVVLCRHDCEFTTPYPDLELRPAER